MDPCCSHCGASSFQYIIRRRLRTALLHSLSPPPTRPLTLTHTLLGNFLFLFFVFGRRPFFTFPTSEVWDRTLTAGQKCRRCFQERGRVGVEGGERKKRGGVSVTLGNYAKGKEEEKNKLTSRKWFWNRLNGERKITNNWARRIFHPPRPIDGTLVLSPWVRRPCHRRSDCSCIVLRKNCTRISEQWSGLRTTSGHIYCWRRRRQFSIPDNCPPTGVVIRQSYQRTWWNSVANPETWFSSSISWEGEGEIGKPRGTSGPKPEGDRGRRWRHCLKVSIHVYV